MVDIETTTNTSGTGIVACVGFSTISQFTPTPSVKPTPTAPVKCFPSHGGAAGQISDTDKIVSILNPNVGTYCAGTDPSWSAQVGGPDPASPAANNYVNSGLEVAKNPPEDCKHFYTSGNTALQRSLCSAPLAAIIKACPYNGGQVDTICGTWWLQSCPLSQTCAVGQPGGSTWFMSEMGIRNKK
jgi:hypothetical protein